MKRRDAHGADAMAGVPVLPAATAWGARAGLLAVLLALTACAGPRSPAPITQRPTTPARAPVAPVTTAPAAPEPSPAPATGEVAAASEVEAAPIVAGRLESRPLGGSIPLPATAPAGEIRQGPSGLKRPYTDEDYARLAATPQQGKRPSETVASVGPAPAGTTGGATMSDGGKFAWPVKGRLIQRFSDQASMGIAIEAAEGTPVHAAEAGRVIFSGRGPRSYGNLVIIKHPDELLSVYAHNRKLLVKEGENVRRGQTIAEVGASGTSSARLGFEVRRQGKPIDPLGFLAGG